MKRALIITAKAVLVITRIATIKRILVALKYKESNKNKYYRFY